MEPMKIRVRFGDHPLTEQELKNECFQCRGTGQRKRPLKVEDYVRSGPLDDLIPCDMCAETGRDLRGGYTYRTSEPVGVGDVVEVPGSEYRPGSQIATVIGLSSLYDGYAKRVLRVVRRRVEAAGG